MLCRRKAFLDVFRVHISGQIRHVSSLEKPAKAFYVTTPIFYPNAAPHIGHLYSMVTADIIARFHRLTEPGRKVYFTTGTDEHGMKMQNAANAAKMAPEFFCRRLRKSFQLLTARAGISNTNFVRTSKHFHHLTAQYVWFRLNERGLIYKGSYAGWYSISDECFYTEDQITKAAPADNPEMIYYVATETGSRVEWIQEENYMFKLSFFRDKLLDHLHNNRDFIFPPARHIEMIEYLKVYPLKDLSISRPRSRLTWGIPVPNDPEHTMYVWFEALISYLSGIKYPVPQKYRAWPPDVQVIGKDILRFHALYLPAILMALGLSLPRRLLTHSHWTVSGEKMSKSVGNVKNPFFFMRIYDPDVVRFYLARVGGRFRRDIDWSKYQLAKHAKEVMSVVGNFYSRCTAEAMLTLVESADIPSIENIKDDFAAGKEFAGKEIIAALFELRKRVRTNMEQLEIGEALDEIIQVLNVSNKVYTTLKPWRTEDVDHTVRAQLHVVSIEALRICGILLQPFMPKKMAVLLYSLGVPQTERSWKFAEVGRGKVGKLRRGVVLFSIPDKRVYPSPDVENE